MKVGAVFPQAELPADRGAVRAYIEGVAELGVDHMTIYDLVVAPDRERHPDAGGTYRRDDLFHEVLVLFGYAAALAPELELVTAIVIAPQRQTGLLAKQAAEIDVLTGGRFRLGLGVGNQAVPYEAMGMDYHNRGRRFEEQIELLRRYWTEEVVDFDGRWHRVNGAGINPLPIQRPIPIWIGAFTEVAMRRAARMADGFFGYSALEGGWPSTIGRMREWVAEAGRDAATFGIELELNAGADPSGQWQATAEEFVSLGASHVGITTTGAGFTSPDQHLERLREARAVVGDGR
jgi:probable F420-dependent oxidoreductase